MEKVVSVYRRREGPADNATVDKILRLLKPAVFCMKYLMDFDVKSEGNTRDD